MGDTPHKDTDKASVSAPSPDASSQHQNVTQKAGDSTGSSRKDSAQQQGGKTKETYLGSQLHSKDGIVSHYFSQGGNIRTIVHAYCVCFPLHLSTSFWRKGFTYIMISISFIPPQSNGKDSIRRHTEIRESIYTKRRKKNHYLR